MISYEKKKEADNFIEAIKIAIKNKEYSSFTPYSNTLQFSYEFYNFYSRYVIKIKSKDSEISNYLFEKYNFDKKLILDTINYNISHLYDIHLIKATETINDLSNLNIFSVDYDLGEMSNLVHIKFNISIECSFFVSSNELCPMIQYTYTMKNHSKGTSKFFILTTQTFDVLKTQITEYTHKILINSIQSYLNLSEIEASSINKENMLEHLKLVEMLDFN